MKTRKKERKNTEERKKKKKNQKEQKKENGDYNYTRNQNGQETDQENGQVRNTLIPLGTNREGHFIFDHWIGLSPQKSRNKNIVMVVLELTIYRN